MNDKMLRNASKEAFLHKNAIDKQDDHNPYVDVLKKLIEKINKTEEENILLCEKLQNYKELLNWILSNIKTIVSKNKETEFLVNVKNFLNN